jgi:two-component system phosphate regulon sensor histidine kinase PhoR
MVEGLVIFDLEGRVVVYNTSAESLLDLPSGSLRIGEPLPAGLVRAAVGELVAGVGGGTNGDFHERALRFQSGRSVRLQAARLPAAPPGTTPSVLVTMRDARDAERLDAMRRDFVANVSHELRTPLAAIRACSATLLGGALGDGARARHFVEVIEHHAERLAQLIDDLGRLSDLEQDRIDIQRRPLAVAPLLRAAVEACVERALAGGVGIDLAVAENAPAARADCELLRQALVMLIDNAVRYTPRGGRVAVSAAACLDAGNANGDAAWVCFRVSDTGIGVPPTDLPRLSERFYRPDKGRSRDRGGPGLGLALVKHIARSHGAFLHIESEVERGTTVTLRWPAGAVAADAGEDRVAAQ